MNKNNKEKVYRKPSKKQIEASLKYLQDLVYKDNEFKWLDK